MKLYATATSERATKGQGGNNHIRLDLNVGSAKDSRRVATITLVALSNGGYEIFFYNVEKDSKAVCIQTGEITKGEKQKGENPIHIGHSEEHSGRCLTRKEYGNCPPWPHG